MRKFLILTLVVISFVVSIMGVACTNPNDGGQDCVHEYIVGEYSLDGSVVKIVSECNKCDAVEQQTVTANLVIKKTDNIDAKMSTVKDGDVVVFEEGSYTSVNTKANVSDVRYIAETGASFSVINVTSGDAVYENLTVTGSGKEEAFNIKSAVDNITIKNCSFTMHGGIYTENNNVASVANLVVENCTFKNIISGSSAIILLRYNGLTVKNSVFENVGYNALQVGNFYNAGNVLIEGNVFKNVQSRVLYFVYVENLDECKIEGNTFYDHEYVYSFPENGPKKETGIYIHTKSTTGVLTVGANTWEYVPSDEEKYIAPVAEYNLQEQIEFTAE